MLPKNRFIVKEQLLKIDGIQDIISAGDTKVSIVLEFEYEVSIDFRLVKPKEFATTLHHFTGSKDHNVRMRQLAKKEEKKSANMVLKIMKLVK